MYQAYFLSNALVVGARIMARQLHPERFYTHEMVMAMATTAAERGRSDKRSGQSSDGE